jgi:hypothetical protein
VVQVSGIAVRKLLAELTTERLSAAAAAAAGRECTLEGDTSSLFYAASALLKLQQMYGLIPRLQVGGRLHGASGMVIRVASHLDA